MDIDRLVYEIQQLAQQAQAASGLWKACEVRFSEEDDPEYCYPDNERQVLVFVNGHLDQSETEARKGGGWGVRLGYFDHDKRRWRSGGITDGITHWAEIPGPPERKKEVKVHIAIDSEADEAEFHTMLCGFVVTYDSDSNPSEDYVLDHLGRSKATCKECVEQYLRGVEETS